MSRNLQTGVLVFVSVLAVVLGRAIPVVFAGRLPQAPGDDVLALVLGDARQELSGALMDKVDEYFHGGVRHTECESGLEEMGEEHDHHHEAHAAEAHSPAPGVGGLWGWINRQVHTQEDRHLKQEQAVELMPWLWAACRASPQNVQAFQVGSFVLGSIAKKPEEAVRLLEEGIRKNPASAELEFSLGEVFLNKLHDAARAEPRFLAARAKCRPAEGPDGEAARGLKVQALFYLGHLAKQKGEPERVGAYLEEAEAVAPDHVCTKNLRELMGKRE